MTNLLKRLTYKEDGLSAFQIISFIAIIGVILTLVVPAATWLSKDYSPEKQRANAIQISEAAKTYVLTHGYKSDAHEVVTVHYFDSASKTVKDTPLEANTYMLISLKDLRSSGSFAAVKDPKTGEEYDQEKTLIYVQEGAKHDISLWITLASGSTLYFDKMRYEDVLDGDAKVSQ
ncbi:type II secretion system protein [Brevibacillus ginsengisoli]|uniref:type II secretion system protein n=1 Tax=Brevibacillus ginsengisoli TaxID=363854 RepID=UPI003CEFF028